MIEESIIKKEREGLSLETIAPISHNWKSGDRERLIFYADLMGFSFKVNRTQHDELYQKFTDFKLDWHLKVKALDSEDTLRNVQFSDSILVAVDGTDGHCFDLITKAATCIMHCALKNQLPLKGVIAQGQFTWDKENEIYFGLPLVDAHILHDEIYYYGVVVHHSAEKTVKDFSDFNNPYTNSQISLKKGQTRHWHLAWHMLDEDLKPRDIKEDAMRWLNKIGETVSGAPRVYIDNTISIVDKDKKIGDQIFSNPEIKDIVVMKPEII